MSRVVVTGAAGFIGSHLSEALLRDGHEVLGVDLLTDYYDPALKQRNLDQLRQEPRFTLVTDDLATSSRLPDLLAGAEVVYHLAAQPGVRLSWSAFQTYVDANLIATDRLVRTMIEARVGHLVFASSSSVYGNAPRYPTREDGSLEPRSPYGVTKLAGEKLVAAYTAHNPLTAFSLRFFTVYGPRQRPDMAIQRMLQSALASDTFELFGDGTAIRDFTYVADIVEACVLAGVRRPLGQPHMALNVGGSGGVSMNDLVGLIEQVTGQSLRLNRTAVQAGDVHRTGADTERVHEQLGWLPTVSLVDGLKEQWKEVVRATREDGSVR